MRNQLLIVLLCMLFYTAPGFAQNLTLQHNSTTREYLLHVPSNYNSANPAVPLIINMHGYGSNALQQQGYTQFNKVADTTGVIIVYPEGLNNAWNASGTVNTPDDVGFISTLIDTLLLNYNIDTNRVYATGMSNGGFMSYRLACQLSNRIAAIASVTGSMIIDLPGNCNQSRTVPVMQIHGTADPTVAYNGTAGFLSQDSVISYWTNKYNCNASATIDSFPDTDQTDMCTAVKYTYGQCNDGAETVFIKIIDGEHTWPDAFIDIAVTNHDFNANEEIWLFFKQYSLKGNDPNTGINESGLNSGDPLQLYPNPFSENLNIGLSNSGTYQMVICDINGKTIYKTPLLSGSVNIDTHTWPTGMYLVQIISEREQLTRRILKF